MNSLRLGSFPLLLAVIVVFFLLADPVRPLDLFPLSGGSAIAPLKEVYLPRCCKSLSLPSFPSHPSEPCVCDPKLAERGQALLPSLTLPPLLLGANTPALLLFSLSPARAPLLFAAALFSRRVPAALA